MCCYMLGKSSVFYHYVSKDGTSLFARLNDLIIINETFLADD